MADQDHNLQVPNILKKCVWWKDPINATAGRSMESQHLANFTYSRSFLLVLECSSFVCFRPFLTVLFIWKASVFLVCLSDIIHICQTKSQQMSEKFTKFPKSFRNYPKNNYFMRFVDFIMASMPSIWHVSHDRSTPLDTWHAKNEKNRWSVNARSIFVFVDVLVPLELRCNLKMSWKFSAFDQLPWRFRNLRFEFLAPVSFSEVKYFIEMFRADWKSTKVKILWNWMIYFVPIVKVFGDLGFVEYISDDFSWSHFDFNCSPLSLWLSKFGVICNGNWRIGSIFGWLRITYLRIPEWLLLILRFLQLNLRNFFAPKLPNFPGTSGNFGQVCLSWSTWDYFYSFWIFA